MRREYRPSTAKSEVLRLSYILLTAACLLPVAVSPGAATSFVKPSTQIWSADAAKTLVNPGNTALSGKISISVGNTLASFNSELATTIFLLFFATGFSWVIFQIVRDARYIRSILKSCIRLKVIGRVSVLVNTNEVLPFSFWIPFRSFVIIPQSLIEDPARLRMVIAHEMQHHRQHDTKWVYLIHAVRGLCFWNPFVHLYERATSVLQEFACDEALVGRQRISSQAYCDCLLWVAQKQMQTRLGLVGTASFIGGSAASLLRRRLEMMLSNSKKDPKSFALLTVSVIAVLFLGVVAHAASASIQDRRISREQAEQMAAVANRDSGFPLLVNDLVLEQLNRYLGTPDGRRFMRQSISRMKIHEPAVMAGIEKYGLPHELSAIPVVESGYRNLPQDRNPWHGAGIWMFIASTARNFGLRVDATVDERLDIPAETDAAMRLLSSLHLKFNDWGLAVLAYNVGEKGVQRGLERSGSRDPWSLIRNGVENDKGYLASVMAAVLILKNPASMD